MILYVLFVLGWMLIVALQAHNPRMDSEIQEARLMGGFCRGRWPGPFDETHHVWPVLKGAEKVGYAFQTNDVVMIPAYPVNP